MPGAAGLIAEVQLCGAREFRPPLLQEPGIVGQFLETFASNQLLVKLQYALRY